MTVTAQLVVSSSRSHYDSFNHSRPRACEVGWHSELAELPSRLVELPARSFVTIHPRHGESEYDARFLRFE